MRITAALGVLLVGTPTVGQQYLVYRDEVDLEYLERYR